MADINSDQLMLWGLKIRLEEESLTLIADQVIFRVKIRQQLNNPRIRV